MKSFRLRLLTLCGMVILAAAALAPIAAQASCPTVSVRCSDGNLKSCQGEQIGTKCYYDEACLNC